MNNVSNMFYHFSATGYDCANNNPCGQGAGYYEHTDPAKYVQCGANQCSVMSCPGGLVWQQNILACNWPNAGGNTGGSTGGTGGTGGAGMTKHYKLPNWDTSKILL